MLINTWHCINGLADTAKLAGPRTFTSKNWVGPVKLLFIIMFKISKIRPKSLFGLVKAPKFSQCLLSARNSSALAMELRLSCTKPSVYKGLVIYVSKNPEIALCSNRYIYRYYLIQENMKFKYNEDYMGIWLLCSIISFPVDHLMWNKPSGSPFPNMD